MLQDNTKFRLSFVVGDKYPFDLDESTMSLVTSHIDENRNAPGFFRFARNFEGTRHDGGNKLWREDLPSFR